MFAVHVELLTGRYVATEFNDRARPEWPPHPARLFSAAVAAWADHGECDRTERKVLEWWEGLGAPCLRCSLDAEVGQRAVVTHYVPVNDPTTLERDPGATYAKLAEAEAAVREATSEKTRAQAERKLTRVLDKARSDFARWAGDGPAPSSKIEVLPERRAKQDRTFPTTIPAEASVVYLWPGADIDDGRLAVLDGVLARVARLGHSSSPVSITATRQAPPGEPTLVPGDGPIVMRVPGPGQLDALIRAYEASEAGNAPRTMPALLESYRRPRLSAVQVPASTIGGDWILLEPVDRAFGIGDTAAAAKRLRRALMSVAADDDGAVPEVISGHQPRRPGQTGSTPASTGPHLMILGLPFAARRHATGTIMAFALMLPRGVDRPAADRDGLAAISVAVEAFLDRGGELHAGKGRDAVRLRPLRNFDAPEAARPQRWAGPAREWVSVTPVALDKNPGRLAHPDPTRADAAADRAAECISCLLYTSRCV